MPHLNPDHLLDIAEGTQPEAAEPHLAACASCRRQLADVRAVLAEVASVAVPEPSPLFWDRLSARIREAVAAEQAPRRAVWRVGEWWWGMASALSVAVAVWAAVVTLRSPAEQARVPPAAMAAAAAPGASAISTAEDPSLSLLAELAGELEWDAAAAGMAAVVGSADVALGDLTDDERAELRRLLDEAMTGKGA